MVRGMLAFGCTVPWVWCELHLFHVSGLGSHGSMAMAKSGFPSRMGKNRSITSPRSSLVSCFSFPRGGVGTDVAPSPSSFLFPSSWSSACVCVRSSMFLSSSLQPRTSTWCSTRTCGWTTSDVRLVGRRRVFDCVFGSTFGFASRQRQGRFLFDGSVTSHVCRRRASSTWIAAREGGGFGTARPTDVVVGVACFVRRTTPFQGKDALDRVACRTRGGSSCNRRWGTCGWESTDRPRWTSIVRVVRRRWDVSTPSSFRVCPDRPTSAPHVAKLWVGYEAWMARRRRHPSGERKEGRNEVDGSEGPPRVVWSKSNPHESQAMDENRPPLEQWRSRIGNVLVPGTKKYAWLTRVLDVSWAPSSPSHPTKRRRCILMRMHVPKPNAVHVANADRGREEETSDMQKPNKTTTTTKLMPWTSWKTNTRDAKHAGPKNDGKKKICAWAAY